MTTALAYSIFLFGSFAVVFRQDLRAPSGTQLGIFVVVLQSAQGARTSEFDSSDSNSSGAPPRRSLIRGRPSEAPENPALSSEEQAPARTVSSNTGTPESDRIGDSTNPAGAAWHLGSGYPSVNQWRRRPVLVVTVADSAILDHLAGRRASKPAVLSYGGEADVDGDAFDRTAEPQHPAADGSRWSSTASQEAGDNTTDTPISARLSSPLWLASFSVSQATCLRGMEKREPWCANVA